MNEGGCVEVLWRMPGCEFGGLNSVRRERYSAGGLQREKKKAPTTVSQEPFWVGLELERKFFGFFDVGDLHLKLGEGFGESVLVGSGTVLHAEGDAVIDVGCFDAVHLFQGQPGPVVGGRSCGAGDGEGVSGLRSGNFFLFDGDEGQSAGFEGGFDFGFVEGLAVLHDDGGPETGEEEFFDAILFGKGRTDPPVGASSAAFDEDGGDGDGVGGDFGSVLLVIGRKDGRREGEASCG